MTNEEQRIAIAKACGVDTPEFNCDLGNECYDDCVEGFNERLKELPDFLNDLNCCHDFEKSLDESQQREYLFHLFGSQRRDDADLYRAVTLTSAQRCEAFLRMKGLWKEEEKV